MNKLSDDKLVKAREAFRNSNLPTGELSPEEREDLRLSIESGEDSELMTIEQIHKFLLG